MLLDMDIVLLSSSLHTEYMSLYLYTVISKWQNFAICPLQPVLILPACLSVLHSLEGNTVCLRSDVNLSKYAADGGLISCWASFIIFWGGILVSWLLCPHQICSSHKLHRYSTVRWINNQDCSALQTGYSTKNVVLVLVPVAEKPQ